MDVNLLQDAFLTKELSMSQYHFFIESFVFLQPNVIILFANYSLVIDYDSIRPLKSFLTR